jgi:aspartate carbamoyltransferase catalytic subunit
MSIQHQENQLPAHLIAIHQLTKKQLLGLLSAAKNFMQQNPRGLLAGKTLVNLFFEPSTRTRCSFELAGKRLGMDVINFETVSSSTTKGETLVDTVRTLAAMETDVFVIRHQANGQMQQLANLLPPNSHLISAGEGTQEHPTQALLDMFTIQKYFPDFTQLTVAIIGDIRHSRVANSDIAALNLLGVPHIRLVGPKEFLPEELPPNCESFTHMEAGIKNANVLIALRIQKERLTQKVSFTTDEYFANYGLTLDRLKLAKPNAIVMHPGPFNREVEIASDVVDCPQSVIFEQVNHGVYCRMAVIAGLLKAIKF